MLLSRASTANLNEPGPTDAQLELILAAAVRAPDHGRLRPWRFLIFRSEARERLGDLYAEAFARREPESPASQMEKERGKPTRSPLLIGVVVKVVEGNKIPVVEQVLSAGAAAMNILNAVHMLGFGAKWVTGGNCYDSQFRAGLGLEAADQLAGFIHVGSLGSEGVPETPRPDPKAFTTEWTRRTDL